MLNPHGKRGSWVLLSFIIQRKPLGPGEASSLVQDRTAKDTTKIRQKLSPGKGQTPPQLPFYTECTFSPTSNQVLLWIMFGYCQKSPSSGRQKVCSV